jgi:hypothetical protein
MPVVTSITFYSPLEKLPVKHDFPIITYARSSKEYELLEHPPKFLEAACQDLEIAKDIIWASLPIKIG